MTTEKKLVAVRVLLAAAIMAYPIIGYLWIFAGMIDFARVHNFKRPIFCISPAGPASPNGGSGTFSGLWYSFEIKGNPVPEDTLPQVTEYTARILNTPVMAGARE